MSTDNPHPSFLNRAVEVAGIAFAGAVIAIAAILLAVLGFVAIQASYLA